MTPVREKAHEPTAVKRMRMIHWEIFTGLGAFFTGANSQIP
jgi:hypothetical protein